MAHLLLNHLANYCFITGGIFKWHLSRIFIHYHFSDLLRPVYYQEMKGHNLLLYPMAQSCFQWMKGWLSLVFRAAAEEAACLFKAIPLWFTSNQTQEILGWRLSSPNGRGSSSPTHSPRPGNNALLWPKETNSLAPPLMAFSSPNHYIKTSAFLFFPSINIKEKQNTKKLIRSQMQILPHANTTRNWQYATWKRILAKIWPG